MEAVLSIAALIVAVGFAVLVIFLAKVLINLSKTLSHVADMTGEIKEPVHGILNNGKEMLHITNKLAEDVHEKSERLNPFVDNVKGIGNKLNDLTNSFKTANRHLSTTVEQNEDKAALAMTWGVAGVQLYKKFQHDRHTY